MKVQPVSADLLIKLALGAAAIGAVWYVVKSARDQIAGAGAAAAEWASNLAEAAQTGARQAAGTAATDAYSLPAIVTYGGPLNPIGRVVAPALDWWNSRSTSDGGATGSW